MYLLFIEKGNRIEEVDGYYLSTFFPTRGAQCNSGFIRDDPQNGRKDPTKDKCQFSGKASQQRADQSMDRI